MGYDAWMQGMSIVWGGGDCAKIELSISIQGTARVWGYSPRITLPRSLLLTCTSSTPHN
jgi:hypothetical protein